MNFCIPFVDTLLWHDQIIFAELLSFYKFPGDDIPIVRGSALSALEGKNEEIGKKAILKLMDAVDSYIPDPVRQLDKSFLMPVEDVFTIQVLSIPHLCMPSKPFLIKISYKIL